MKGKNKSNVKCWIFLFLQPNSEPKSFTFDGVYGTNSTTEAIYNDNGFDLVEVKEKAYMTLIYLYYNNNNNYRGSQKC